MVEHGAALLAGGRFHEALALFAQLLQQDPASTSARIGLARASIGAGDPDAGPNRGLVAASRSTPLP